MWYDVFRCETQLAWSNSEVQKLHEVRVKGVTSKEYGAGKIQSLVCYLAVEF